MNIRLEQIELLGNRILVLRDKKTDELTEKGLVVAAVAQDDPPTGEVVAIGDAVTKFKVGDHILFGQYAGARIMLYFKEYLLMSEPEPVCIIKPMKRHTPIGIEYIAKEDLVKS